MTTKSGEAVDHESTPDNAASTTGSTALRRSTHAADNQAAPAQEAAEDTRVSSSADGDPSEAADPVPDQDRRTEDKASSGSAETFDREGADRDGADNEATALIAPVGNRSSSEPSRPLYRDEASEHTQVMSAEHTQLLNEVDETDWDEQRRAREEALGMKQRPPAYVEEEPQTVAPVKFSKSPRSTDRFLGSLGLFLLRVVVAGIMGLHGVAKLMSLSSVEAMLAGTVIPYPQIMALVLSIAEVAIAVALLLGVFVRIAGVGVAAIGIGALVFVLWIAFPFQNGYELIGEKELLLGAVGVLFLCLGGGRWGIDGSFRAARRRKKELAAAEQV